MLTFALFGAGRIGAIHAANVAANPSTRLKYVVDLFPEAAGRLAQRHGAEVADVARALADPEVNAVVIGSPTDTHADLIEASAKAGKAIFCEKPIDLSLTRVDACLNVVKASGVPFAVGFNRRYDPTFQALQAALAAGRIGKLEQLEIVSRDPSPPPPSYIASSGGLFRDMMIHDLDMARFLLGQEPTEVYATASCLVDPAIGAAGDVDTAVVVLKTRDGTICQISNSRRAVYGYDQRIEAFGSKGRLRAENLTPTRLEITDETGVSTDKPLHFFLERYADAYRLELQEFIEVVAGKAKPKAGGIDGRAALALADAAVESVKTGLPVKVDTLGSSS